jgi:hypothetical protein
MKSVKSNTERTVNVVLEITRGVLGGRVFREYAITTKGSDAKAKDEAQRLWLYEYSDGRCHRSLSLGEMKKICKVEIVADVL